MPIPTEVRRPSVELHPVSAEDVPSHVATRLAERSIFYTHKMAPLQLGDFDELLVAHHENGISSFVARHDKTYATNGHTDRIFHVVDTRCLPESDVIGYGELRLALTDPSPYYLNKPFVGSLSTEEKYRRTRHSNILERLSVLAELAETRLGLPLYTDSLISKPAQMVVHHLERMGLLEEVFEDDVVRYKSMGIGSSTTRPAAHAVPTE